MSFSMPVSRGHANVPEILIDGRSVSPSVVRFDIGIDVIPPIVPLVRIKPIRGGLNRSRNVWLQVANTARGGSTYAIEGFLIDRDGNKLGREAEVPPGMEPLIAVDGEILRQALEGSLGNHDDADVEAGNVMTAFSIRMLANRTSKSQWLDISVLVGGVSPPPPAKCVVSARRIAVDQIDVGKSACACEILVSFSPRTAFAPVSGLSFEIVVVCLGSLTPAGAALQLVPVSNSAQLVEPSHASETENAVTGTAQHFRFFVPDPKGLALTGEITLRLSINPASLMLQEGHQRVEGHLQLQEYPVEISGRWIDGGESEGGDWQFQNAATKIVLVNDSRQWATVSLGDKSEQILRDEARSEVRLPRFELALPQMPSIAGAIFIDELAVQLFTNTEIKAPVYFEIILVENSGEQICKLTDYWDEPGITGILRQTHICAVIGHNISLAQPMLERSLRSYLAEQHKTSGKLQDIECRIRIQKIKGQRGALDWLPELHFAIAFVEQKASWPICIDVGMSATSVWIERPYPPDAQLVSRQEVLPVNLGSMHAQIDRDHDEMPPAGSAMKVEDTFLLPSHLAIGSAHGIRTRYLPLSLGNLELALDDEASTQARLRFLGRHHDISVPFPNKQHISNADTVYIGDIKQKITTGQKTIYAGRQVWWHDPSSGKVRKISRIVTHELLGDYLDELLKLYVSRFMLGYSRTDFLPFDLGDEDIVGIMANPRIVLTHPAGIGEEQLEIYRNAARPVVRRISGQQFDFNVADEQQLQADEPVLILESVAAARYSIDKLGHQLASMAGPDGKSSLVSLDIGAGTFDVSILALEANNRTFDFEVLQSFGLGIAGERLDAALITRVAAILCELFQKREAEEAFGTLSGQVRRLPTHDDRAQWGQPNELLIRLKRQLRLAKARLSEQIFEKNSPGYSWPQDLTLDILIDEKQELQGIIEFSVANLKSRKRSFSVNRTDIELQYVAAGEAGPDGEGKNRGSRTFLRLGPDAFDSRHWQLEEGLVTCADVVEALGRIVPEIAIETARGFDPLQPLNIIVTGRTSLWPPLYSEITKTVADSGHAAKMLSPMPFAAQEMKTAVVRGASLIARENLDKLLRPVQRNPVAIIELSRRLEGADPTGEFVNLLRPSNVHYLTGAQLGAIAASGEKLRETVFRKEIAAHDSFVIARAIPGLDIGDRLNKLNRVEPRAVFHSEFEGQSPQRIPRNKPLIVEASEKGRDRVTVQLECEGHFNRFYFITGDKVVLQSAATPKRGR